MAAREEGPSLVQSFYESMERKGGYLHQIVADVCAFANTNGGTVYVGLSAKKDKPLKGLTAVNDSVQVLQNEISRSITPALDVEIDTQETQGKTIIRILVPYGEERPYAINDNQIYLRDEGDTNLAVRDEIVNLVQQGLAFQRLDNPNIEPAVQTNGAANSALMAEKGLTDSVAETSAPRAGVEIVATEERSSTKYFTMHDLRNGNIVKNVTRSSARRLWHYAIKQHDENPVDPQKVDWRGDLGLWRRYEKAGFTRYDLVQRENGRVRVYYGVTENGMHGRWAEFLDDDSSD